MCPGRFALSFAPLAFDNVGAPFVTWNAFFQVAQLPDYEVQEAAMAAIVAASTDDETNCRWILEHQDLLQVR